MYPPTSFSGTSRRPSSSSSSLSSSQTASSNIAMSSSSLYDFTSPPQLSYIPLPISMSPPSPYTASPTFRSIEISQRTNTQYASQKYEMRTHQKTDVPAPPLFEPTLFSVHSHSAPTASASWTPATASSSVPISPLFTSRPPVFTPAQATVPIVMSAIPLYVERLTSFYSFTDVQTLFTAINASLNDFPIEYVVSPAKAKIDAIIADSLVHFIIRLYECPSSATLLSSTTAATPSRSSSSSNSIRTNDNIICVEVQRRHGDSYAFANLFNQLVNHWKRAGLVSAMYDQTLDDEFGANDALNQPRAVEQIRMNDFMDHIFPISVDLPLFHQLTQLCLQGEMTVQYDVLQCLDHANLHRKTQNALSSLIGHKVGILQQRTADAIHANKTNNESSNKAVPMTDTITAWTSIDPSELCVLTSLIHHYCASHPQAYMELIIALLQQTASTMAATAPSTPRSSPLHKPAAVKPVLSSSIASMLYQRIIIRHLMSAILALYAVDSTNAQWTRLTNVMMSTGKQCNDLTVQAIIAQTQYQLRPLR